MQPTIEDVTTDAPTELRPRIEERKARKQAARERREAKRRNRGRSAGIR